MYPNVIALRTFCDPQHPQCRLCPDAASDLDSDGDGIPDGCDFCTDTDGQAAMTDILLRSKELATPDFKKTGFQMKGALTLPAGAPAFADLALDQNGAWLHLEGDSDAQIVEIGLPPGLLALSEYHEGWVRKPSGRQWGFIGARYSSPLQTGTGRIRRLSLTDRTRNGRRTVRFKLSGDGYYDFPQLPIIPFDLPLRAWFTLGSQTAQGGVSCHEVFFAPSDCQLDSLTWKTECRR